ncbi:translation initiation factor IF-2-like [Strigops habroptila]|uniref:translation initiation factor IF-2-like n=1 Tax=Strigops habroptila TaxID=2489341 RepID=UPI0011CF81BD|nr:translation initiation factor IF-2-like [Strigops habroptila]
MTPGTLPRIIFLLVAPAACSAERDTQHRPLPALSLPEPHRPCPRRDAGQGRGERPDGGDDSGRPGSPSGLPGGAGGPVRPAAPRRATAGLLPPARTAPPAAELPAEEQSRRGPGATRAGRGAQGEEGAAARETFRQVRPRPAAAQRSRPAAEQKSRDRERRLGASDTVPWGCEPRAAPSRAEPSRGAPHPGGPPSPLRPYLAEGWCRAPSRAGRGGESRLARASARKARRGFRHVSDVGTTWGPRTAHATAHSGVEAPAEKPAEAGGGGTRRPCCPRPAEKPLRPGPAPRHRLRPTAGQGEPRGAAGAGPGRGPVRRRCMAARPAPAPPLGRGRTPVSPRPPPARPISASFLIVRCHPWSRSDPSSLPPAVVAELLSAVDLLYP